jgi:hypothetical protein
MEEKNRNLKRGKTIRDNSDPRNHIRREDEDDNNTEGTPNRGFQGSGTVQDKKGLSLAAKIAIGVLIVLGVGVGLAIFLF